MSFALPFSRSFGRQLHPVALLLPRLRPLWCGSTNQSARARTMASALPRLPVFEAISRHDPDSIAVIHSNSGRQFRYGELLGDVCKVRNRLYETAGRDDIDGERIAFLVENSYDYVGKLDSCLLTKLARCAELVGYTLAWTNDIPPTSHISCHPRGQVHSGTAFPCLPGA